MGVVMVGMWGWHSGITPFPCSGCHLGSGP